MLPRTIAPTSDGLAPDLAIAVRTLVSGGFLLESAERNPGYALLHMSRPDEFGATHRYAFAVAEDRFGPTQIAAATISAKHRDARLVLIGNTEDGGEAPVIDWDRFVTLFGGPVYSTSPYEPEFAEQLVVLGHNGLPAGLTGQPDDLFEAYARVALEFIFGGRVVRYGQDRRFEARPDGIIMPRQEFSALYDAKAYAAGYPVTAETIRQFKSYVQDFARRYGAYLQRLNAFVVVSGTFVQGAQALEARNRELFAECGVPLVFLKAADLAEIVTIFAERPAIRGSIDWRRIFADPIVRPARVRSEAEAIRRDCIIPEAQA